MQVQNLDLYVEGKRTKFEKDLVSMPIPHCISMFPNWNATRLQGYVGIDAHKAKHRMERIRSSNWTAKKYGKAS